MRYHQVRDLSDMFPVASSPVKELSITENQVRYVQSTKFFIFILYFYFNFMPTIKYTSTLILLLRWMLK